MAYWHVIVAVLAVCHVSNIWAVPAADRLTRLSAHLMWLSEQALQQYTTSWLGDPHRRYNVDDEASSMTPYSSSTPARKVYLLAARLQVFVGWNPHPPRYLQILQTDTCTLLHALNANNKNSCIFHGDLTADMKMPKKQWVRDMTGYVILRDLRDAFTSFAGTLRTTAEPMIMTTEVPQIEVTMDEPQIEVTTDGQKEISSENDNLASRASSSSP